MKSAINMFGRTVTFGFVVSLACCCPVHGQYGADGGSDEFSSSVTRLRELGARVQQNGRRHFSVYYRETGDAGDEFAQLVSRLPGTKLVSIDDGNLSEAAVSRLSGTPGLEKLTFRYTANVTDDTVEAIRSNSDLKMLQFCSQTNELTDRGARRIAELEHVQSLSVHHADISDNAVGDLLRMPSLRVLDIQHCERVTFADATAAQYSRIRSLSLVGCPVSTAGALCASLMPNLQFLDLSETEISDASLEHFVFRRRDYGPLSWVKVADTQISDGGLRSLSFIRLSSLDISGTRATDQGLQQLAECRNLRSVNARKTAVTDRGRRELLEALPNLRFARHPGDTSSAFVIDD